MGSPAEERFLLAGERTLRGLLEGSQKKQVQL